jgi:hypothetical protein
MPFPAQINVQPAPAVAGDFASANYRTSVLAGPGGLVTGASGVIIGNFGWYDPTNQQVVNNFGSGPVAGFVHREQQGEFTTYLAEASLGVLPGMPITLMSSGDYWIKNSGTTEVLVGQSAYATYATGAATFAAAGSPTTATAATSTIGAAATPPAFTGSIGTNQGVVGLGGNILTVSAVSAGAIYPGTIIAGVGVATNTQVTAQLTGTTGGVGTYTVNIPEQSVASESMTGTYGVLTLGAAPSAAFGVGDVLSGTNVTTGTAIWQLLTGTGGSGSTYVVSPSQTAGSTTITATLNVQTKWVAASPGAPGELVKITSWLLG